MGRRIGECNALAGSNLNSADSSRVCTRKAAGHQLHSLHDRDGIAQGAGRLARAAVFVRVGKI